MINSMKNIFFNGQFDEFEIYNIENIPLAVRKYFDFSKELEEFTKIVNDIRNEELFDFLVL